jgi:adenosyl cobinamide kinase/adenosyl cobinamide phosphate guanylyltransferase
VIVLVIGGTRSGKSVVGERIATDRGEPVTFVAPAVPVDPEHAARIAAHRARRPATWSTIECGPDLVGALDAATGTVLVDSLGTWVNVSMCSSPDTDIDVQALVASLQRRGDPTVVVTEEVGLAIHPVTDAGRAFVDALGALNAEVARVADRVLLVIAGRTVELGA